MRGESGASMCGRQAWRESGCGMEIDSNGLAEPAKEERDEKSLHSEWSLQALPLPPSVSALCRRQCLALFVYVALNTFDVVEESTTIPAVVQTINITSAMQISQPAGIFQNIGH